MERKFDKKLKTIHERFALNRTLPLDFDETEPLAIEGVGDDAGPAVNFDASSGGTRRLTSRASMIVNGKLDTGCVISSNSTGDANK